jgi:hypothetical protein
MQQGGLDAGIDLNKAEQSLLAEPRHLPPVSQARDRRENRRNSVRFWGYRDRPAEEVREVHDVTGPTEADVEKAYEKGRRDERARHRSHPIIGLVVAVVALVGGAMLFLAAREGSFAQGGRVMDAQIATASDTAQVASQDARDKLHQDTASR